MVLTLSKELLEKYLGILSAFDDKSKKELIARLKETLQTSEAKPYDLNKLSGAWEDSKSSDQIIEEIRTARVNSREIAF